MVVECRGNLALLEDFVFSTHFFPFVYLTLEHQASACMGSHRAVVNN